MELQGKAKEEFEKYYIQIEGLQDKTIQSQRLELLLFYAMSEPKKYGVLVDWFDSVGVDIEIILDSSNKGDFTAFVNNNMLGSTCHSRPQARQQAIKKAVEILNNRV